MHRLTRITITPLLVLSFFASLASAQISLKNYQSLDSAEPIQLTTGYFVYKSDTFQLNNKALFIDNHLSDKAAAQSPYLFNSFRQAAEHLENGTENAPMTLYIAPSVYWIDNPDDTAIRVATDGSIPFGLKIKCDWLRIIGLNSKPQNVVLACNRGQTIGAKGNFTMLHIDGEATYAENVTFGNYCNVDLSYPLSPERNRLKRASAIVQAQLIICNGDKIYAKNCRFISRLNLCPFVGGKRTFFENCHFECTDDALAGTAIYLNSTFEFYSSKPFYHTTGTGAIFLNCNINSYTHGKQYFTKANGQLAVIDTRIKGESVEYLGWNNNPKQETKNYQYGVTLNRQKQLIENKYQNRTVSMADKKVLNAYIFYQNRQKQYNIYNLLKGNDDWDPLNQKESIQKAEQDNSMQYTDIPVQLVISKSQLTIETGKDSLLLTASAFRFGKYASDIDSVIWWVIPESAPFVKLQTTENGKYCTIIPNNHTNKTQQIKIQAKTLAGLEAASVVYIAPEMLPPPAFIKKPTIIADTNNTLQVDYLLNTEFKDQSVIRWYRCSDSLGTNPIQVATSRNDIPLKKYPLSINDIGYYIMVSVAPRHSRCSEGEAEKAIFPQAIPKEWMRNTSTEFYTNFSILPAINQAEILPGFWTLDIFRSPDTVLSSKNWKRPENAWYYGKGKDGAAGYFGLIPAGRNASMYFTPIPQIDDSITVTYVVAPFKSAGQGFSVAPLYMDFLIGFDAQTANGYGVRFVRTTKYGNAVDCFLLHYKNGKAYPIGKRVSTSCFHSPCTITLKVNENTLSVFASTTHSSDTKKHSGAILGTVHLSTHIEKISASGIGINFNGGAPVLIQEVEVLL